MAGTITAAQTTDPGAPQVGVTVSGLSTTTATSLVVETSWDAGATWQGVRGGAISSALGSAFVRDYVPALNTPCLYRARWVSGPLFYSRAQLVTNPKASIDLTGWAAANYGTGGAGTLTRITGQSMAGLTTAGRMTWTTAPTGVAGTGVFWMSAAGSVAAGNVYSFGAYGRPSWAGATTSILLQWLDSSNTVIGTVSGTPVSHAQNATERRTLFGQVAPAGASRVYVRMSLGSGSAPAVGDTFDMTGFYMEYRAGSNVGAYFDGDTVGDGRYSYSWTGTPGASASNEYSNEIWSSSLTISSDQAWIQDPLDPRSAVPLYADMSSGHVLLTLGSLASAKWAQHVDLATVVGASLPVASSSVRQKAGQLPFVLTYEVAAEGGALRNMLMGSGQLVVRGLSIDGLLDPVAHVSVGDAIEGRLSVGQIAQWTLTARQVRPITMNVVVPWWTYDQVKSLVQSQVGSTATFDQVKAAQPAGKTYTQWVANPGVV